MNTISNDYNGLIEIKKSKFITEIKKVNEVDEATDFIKSMRIKYKDAKHYCYAYIIDDFKRCSDDGEPGGTAGAPILNVLESRDLNHVVVVVIRYFGGILLGAGGLVRAYTKGVTECLKEIEIVPIKKFVELKICFNYDSIKDIDRLLKNCVFISKDFLDLVCYQFYILEDDYLFYIDYLSKACLNVSILKTCYI